MATSCENYHHARSRLPIWPTTATAAAAAAAAATTTAAVAGGLNPVKPASS